MFVLNDDNSIYVTRGDAVYLKVSCKKNGAAYTFEPGEVLRVKVYGKKNCTNVVLQKDFPITANVQKVDVILSGADTKFGEVINKPRDYWYEVELNPFDEYPQTIIGYGEDGPCLFRLFPEGDDVEESEPIKPEDIPVVDGELDMTSERPVANQAVARAFANLQGAFQSVHEAVAELHVTPQMFGAIGDGEADDTEALQMAIDSNSTIRIPRGTYLIRTSTDDTAEYGDGEGIGVRIPSNRTVIFEDGAVLKAIPNASKRYRVLWATDSENIVIRGGVIECDKTLGAGSHGFGLLFRHCKNVTVENMTVYNALADCVAIGCYADSSATGSECENITLRDCEFYSSRRQGITLSGVDGCVIERCYIHDVAGLNPQSGIDIEVNNPAEQRNTNIRIIATRFENNANYDVIVSKGLGTDTVEISDCDSSGVITNLNNLCVKDSELNIIRASGGNTRVLGCNIVQASSTAENAYFADCIINTSHVGAGACLTVERSAFITDGPVFISDGATYVSRTCYCYSGGVMKLNGCTFKTKNCEYVMLGGEIYANNCVFEFDTDDTFTRLAYVDNGVFSGCTFSIDSTAKEIISPRSADGVVKIIGCRFLTDFYEIINASTTNRFFIGNIFLVNPSAVFNNEQLAHDNINAY